MCKILVVGEHACKQRSMSQSNESPFNIYTFYQFRSSTESPKYISRKQPVTPAAADVHDSLALQSARLERFYHFNTSFSHVTPIARYQQANDSNSSMYRNHTSTQAGLRTELIHTPWWTGTAQ